MHLCPLSGNLPNTIGNFPTNSTYRAPCSENHPGYKRVTKDREAKRDGFEVATKEQLEEFPVPFYLPLQV
jgi:hypothetical protein